MAEETAGAAGEQAGAPGADSSTEPTFEERCARAEEKADNYLKNWQREAADFRNFKRRIEQEREDIVKYANMDLVRQLLPLLDDFDRAFETLPADLSQLTWCEGMVIIHRKMEAILQRAGLTEIQAQGEEFDPQVHEAVMHDETPGVESGKVASVLQRGYRFRDRVLRPAMVKVAK